MLDEDELRPFEADALLLLQAKEGPDDAAKGVSALADILLRERAAVQRERDQLAQENARQEQVIKDLRRALQAAESRYQYLKIGRRL